MLTDEEYAEIEEIPLMVHLLDARVLVRELLLLRDLRALLNKAAETIVADDSVLSCSDDEDRN